MYVCCTCTSGHAARAEEQREHRAENPPTVSQPSCASKAKKPKVIPPELEERQQRAKARMLQLGVTPIEVRTKILFLCVL